MVQSYRLTIADDDAEDALVTDINARDEALRSAFSGTAFPVSPAPVGGQKAWRTDLVAMFTYTGAAWRPDSPIVLNLAALKALTPGIVNAVLVLGKTSVTDQWGGTFYWDAGSAATGDDALIVTPDAGGTGRWRRQLNDNQVTPEMFGAKRDGVTADTAALQTCFNSGLPVWLNEGTYLSAALTVPAGSRIRGHREAIIKQSSTAGDFITISGNDVQLEGFTIDGGHTTNTYAGGYIGGHNGVVCYATKSDVRLSKVAVKNFGDTGVSLRSAVRPKVTECDVRRCGYAGIAFWSTIDGQIKDNIVDDIYPGYGGVAPYLSAYGITVSHYSGEAVPDGFEISGNYVSNVTGWEGIDTHNGKNGRIENNEVENCSQGIVVECHDSGISGISANISGNRLKGWGGSPTSRSGQSYNHIGGIICNGGPANTLGESLSIVNNHIDRMGDVIGASTSGAIRAKNWRNVVISMNTIRLCYRAGIVLDHEGTTNGGILYASVMGNSIDGVVAIGGIARGIEASARVMGVAVGNFVNSLGTGSSYYYQASTPTYVMDYSVANKTN